MTLTFVSGIGSVFSADIAVPEYKRELKFYSRVLTTGDNPLWRADLMNNQGIPIIGLGEQTEEYEQLPLQWMPHIQVADVAESIQIAKELGGQILMQNLDGNGPGQWAVLLDPDEAAFGIIPVVSEDGYPLGENKEIARFGCISWLDLTTIEASTTRDFYEEVIGWNVQEKQMENSGDHYIDYKMAVENGDSVAGICHTRGVNAQLPAVWLIYLPVDDLEESLQRVEAEGGKTIEIRQLQNGENSTAIVQDPVGAYFALAQW